MSSLLLLSLFLLSLSLYNQTAKATDPKSFMKVIEKRKRGEDGGWNSLGKNGTCDQDSLTLTSCLVLESFANEKREIIISITNPGNKVLWYNWALSLLNLGIKNFVTVVMGDVEAKEKCLTGNDEVDSHLIVLPLHLRKKLEQSTEGSEISSFQRYKSPVYTTFMKLVPELNYWLAIQKYSILYTDTDIVALSDPFEAIQNVLGDKEWLVSADDTGDPKNLTFCTMKRVCGGLFYARSSYFSVLLFEKWVKHTYLGSTDLSRNQGNQHAYNLLIRAVVGTGKVGILPCDQFPNGRRFNEQFLGDTWRPAQSRPPVMVHNNFVIGDHTKIRLFIRWGMWHVDFDELPNKSEWHVERREIKKREEKEEEMKEMKEMKEREEKGEGEKKEEGREEGRGEKRKHLHLKHKQKEREQKEREQKEREQKEREQKEREQKERENGEGGEREWEKESEKKERREEKEKEKERSTLKLSKLKEKLQQIQQ